MTKIIEFDSEQVETEDIKKIVKITETKDVIKKVSVERLEEEIDMITQSITELQQRKAIKEAERDEIKTTLNIT